MCWDLRALWSAELLIHTRKPALGPAGLGCQAWLLTCLTKGDQADFICSELAGPGQPSAATAKVKQSLILLARMGGIGPQPLLWPLAIEVHQERLFGLPAPPGTLPWLVICYLYFCPKVLWFLRKYGPRLQDGTRRPPWCSPVYFPRASQDSTKTSCQH